MKSNKIFKTVIAVLLLVGSVLFNLNAQVTIGSNVAPTATLDIISDTVNVKGNGFRLIDGNEANNKVLVSNDNGVGSWQMLHYTSGGNALVDNVVELPIGRQVDWEIRTQKGVRVGSVCQLRLMLRYTGPTILNIEDYGISTGDILLYIVHPDFIPLDNCYTTGYKSNSGGLNYLSTIFALTTSSTILFRYIQNNQINSGDLFYMTTVYTPNNYWKVGAGI